MSNDLMMMRVFMIILLISYNLIIFYLEDLKKKKTMVKTKEVINQRVSYFFTLKINGLPCTNLVRTGLEVSIRLFFVALHFKKNLVESKP